MTVDPNFDLRTLIALTKPGGAMRNMVYILCWTGWEWRQMAHAPEALADAYVLNLSNLTRPGAVTPPVTRSAMDIPFASASVWNIGIGANATWKTAGADITKLRSLGLGVNVTTNYGQPIYYGSPSDPLVTFNCSGSGGDGSFPWSYNMHCPAGAQPSSPGDFHMNLYSSDDPTVALSMFFCQSTDFGALVNGSVVTSFLGAKLDLRKNGVFRQDGDFLGTTNYLGGIITERYDLPQGVIKHALRIGLSRDAIMSPNNTQGSTLNVPWPNDHVDYDGPSTYSGPILAGVTIGIPASVNINTLGLSTGGLMLARCLQDYGAIWRDSAGANAMTIYSSSAGHARLTEMAADGPKIMPVLAILSNQAVSSADLTHVNGGGTSRAPLLPQLI